MEKTTNTRKFLIATHGSLAAGVKSSLEIITGPAENLFLIEAYVAENKSLEEEIQSVLEQVGDNDELIIFTDLLGGSVTNQVLQNAMRSNVHIVSGFNLALVIEIVLSDPQVPAEQAISEAIPAAKDQMVYVNKLLSIQNNENDHD